MSEFYHNIKFRIRCKEASFYDCSWSFPIPYEKIEIHHMPEVRKLLTNAYETYTGYTKCKIYTESVEEKIKTV